MMLQAPDKGMSQVYGTKGVLSRLWRKILFDTQVNVAEWFKLMDLYVKDKRNEVPDNRRDQSSHQGNLAKELVREKMTWVVFCKALRFRRIFRFDIYVRLYHQDGRITTHSIPVYQDGSIPVNQNERNTTHSIPVESSLPEVEEASKDESAKQ